MKNLVSLSALLLAAFITVGGGAARADDPSGTWVMTNGKVTVRVSQCSSSLCARIVGLKEPRDRAGKPKVDKLNPNPALRRQPLVGLSLAKLQPAGVNNWSGTIYNPDDGRTYSASLMVKGAVMQVKGCVAGILCKTTHFRRK